MSLRVTVKLAADTATLLAAPVTAEVLQNISSALTLQFKSELTVLLSLTHVNLMSFVQVACTY